MSPALLLGVFAALALNQAQAGRHIALRAKRDLVQDSAINYQCPPGTVLTVLNHDVDVVRMTCKVPAFCGDSGNKQTGLTASQCPGNGPPNTNDFITSISKSTSSAFSTNCWQFNKPSNADSYQSNCGSYSIAPRGTNPNPPPLRPSQSSSNAQSSGTPAPSPVGVVPVAHPNGQSSGSGQAAPAPPPAVDSKIAIDHHDSAANTDFPAVTGITPTATGWRVDFCKPTCTSTTTTKQPTTQPPKNSKQVGSCSSQGACASMCVGGGSGFGPTKRKRQASGNSVVSSNCNNGVCTCTYGQGGNGGGNSGGGGGGGGFCYSADSTVTTPSGPMRMDALKIGHQVLVFNEATRQTSFETVDSFIHRRDDVTTKFVDIHTDAGSHMSLTPGHMVPVVECDAVGSPELKAAGSLALGQCVLVNRDGQVNPSKIVGLAESTKTGIYAPLTHSGTVVVDDTVGSCYSNYEGFNTQNSFYRVFMMAQKALFGTSNAVVDVPPILYLFDTISH